ncbi:intestinal mucin-like protein [Mobula birostris]|uniref:intestinal mucin-like protein n=1 Tax=Mobula birostris TaxID=1983395 RepID=UPI003B285F6C
MARCIDKDIISLKPVVCPTVEPIKCANGRLPVKVYDEYQCCYHYECDCYCNGWGGSHVVTFDGRYYSYEGSCSYVLVEETSPSLQNFGVYVDNYYCDTQDSLTCQRGITVKFENLNIQVTNINPNGIQNLVTINGSIAPLPYIRDNVRIFRSGINIMVHIPKIKALITSSGLAFAIKFPSELFGNKTQGHCGTCNNIQNDDCMLPSGQIVSSCSEMVDYWQNKDPSKPGCNGPSTPLTTARPQVTILPQTTQQPCKSNSLCKLITSKLFEKCHAFVLPDSYYQACVRDECLTTSTSVVCASLQTYATTCMTHGICIDWRNYTHGECSFDCPSNKIYKACGIFEKEHICRSSSSDWTGLNLSEGCLCSPGTILFSPDSDLCVDKCGCLGPDGLPKEFDETFKFNCQDCICDKITHQVICQPYSCPDYPAISCDGEGFVSVNVTITDDNCCTKPVCRCNNDLCKDIQSDIQCELGLKASSKIPEGKCCPVHSCGIGEGPEEVHENVPWKERPGAIIPLSECQICTCSNETDPASQLNIMFCRNKECNKDCAQESEHGQEKESCKREKKMVHINYEGCKSIQKVEVAECEGTCGTNSSP